MKRIILVKGADDFGMGGSNCIELYCTFLKDGSLSLRECINRYSDGRYYLKSIRGIKTSKQFINALSNTEMIMSHFSTIEVLEVLFKNSPSFAALTVVYDRISDNNIESEFFCKNFKYLRNTVIDIPKEFEKAVSLLDAMYYFVKKWHDSNQSLPHGKHHILNREVVFPPKTNKHQPH